MAVGRLSGRPAWVPLAPRVFLSSSLGWVSAGQTGCGIAWTRCQAATIPSVQGQLAAILRVLRRPPQTRRAAA